jgi:ParB/RepB/Spo0J family partition protein
VGGAAAGREEAESGGVLSSALAVSEAVVDYPLAAILDPTIKNYRTNFRGIEELEASVRESGIRVPLVLRPSPLTPDAHELAIGARRREAARRAGLETVPVIIRELTDEEVHTERAIENLQRVDPDPLDEADGFAAMVKLGWSEGLIATRLGKPTRYVVERLALCNLCEEGRKALTEGHMLVGVAIEVAKLAPSLQPEAVKEVGSHWAGSLYTVADARDAISKRIMLRLDRAPFALDDPALVPEVGPCTTCRKRTGTQAELFAGFDADLCTDSACHKGKLDALWKLRVKTAKADGVTVLSKKDGAEALKSARANYGSGAFVRLDEEVYLGAKRPKSLKAAFGKELPPVTLARDEDSGTPVELVPRKAVEALLKAHSPARGGTDQSPKADAKAKAEREAERVKAEVNRRAMTAIVEAADAATRKGKAPRALLRLAVRGALDSVWTDVTKKVADRRGLPLTDEAQGTTRKGAKRQLERLTPAVRIERLLETLDEGALFALLLELAMGRSVPGKWSEGSDCYVDLCAELGVDTKALEKAVKAERKEKAQAKTPPRPEHPATGQVVHYIDPTGLRKTGVACGGKVGDGKGIVTDDAARVTCKSCGRTARLEID